MAHSRSRILERGAGDRDELPGIRGGVERELQDAVGRVVPDFAVRRDVGERRVPQSPRTRDDLADAVLRVERAVGCLRREALVVAGVAVHDEIGPCGVQVVPQRFDRVPDDVDPGIEAGIVPVSDDALLGGGGEVGLEPQLLGGAHGHRDVAVQRHDVPAPQVVAVIALRRISRRRTEVAEVSRGARRRVIEVARSRQRARVVASPGGRITVGKIGVRPGGGGIITCRKHGTGDAVEQFGRGLVARLRARGDVAGADQRNCRSRGGKERGRGGHTRQGLRRVGRAAQAWVVDACRQEHHGDEHEWSSQDLGMQPSHSGRLPERSALRVGRFISHVACAHHLKLTGLQVSSCQPEREPGQRDLWQFGYRSGVR